MSDALASWNPGLDGRFGAGRGTATADVVTRGSAAGAATGADAIAARGRGMSPKKRSSKDVERSASCDDALDGVVCSNENRSTKAEPTGDGLFRFSASTGKAASVGWIVADTEKS